MPHPLPMARSRRDVLGAAFLVGVFWTVANQLLIYGPSADLMALWMAAEAFAEGSLGSIYPVETAFFAMQPPADWAPKVEALGHTGPFYPYIYPPLFAALVAPLTTITEYPVFLRIAGYLNVIMLVCAVLLASRAGRTRVSLTVQMLIVLTALVTSEISMLALHENQPQILVTLLLVLTIERSILGKSAAAGAALAAAAAIKVYPVIFLLVFFVRQDWRAVIAFMLTGGALGLLSIGLAGWPLHATFLEQLAAISGTVLSTLKSYNLHTVLADLFHADRMIWIDATTAGDMGTAKAGWDILQKPTLWQGLTTLLVLSLATGFALLIRRNPDRQVALWVAMLAAVSISLPLSWPYYFIPLILFLPVLVRGYGTIAGGIIILVFLAPTLIFFVHQLRDATFMTSANKVLALGGILIAIIAYTMTPPPDRAEGRS